MFAGAIGQFRKCCRKSLEANEFGKNGYMGAVLGTFDHRDGKDASLRVIIRTTFERPAPINTASVTTLHSEVPRC